MRAGYKKDVNTTQLILESETFYCEDYQMKMLKENHIEGLLQVRGRGIDQTSQYCYTIGGKLSMKAMYEKAQFQYQEMYEFIRHMSETIKNVKCYLLDPDCLLLHPEYVFYEEGTYYFCYYPVREGRTLCESFHELTEFFVSRTDYQDERGICLTYELHKATMKENYSIDQILSQIGRKHLEKTVTVREEVYEEPEPQTDTIMPEQCTAKIRDRKNIWRKIVQKREKKKKEKWGDWEGLIIED